METSNIGSGIKHQPHTQTRAVRNEQGEDENNRRKKTKPSGENPRKEDTVTISEEGMKRFSFRKLNFPIEWNREGLPPPKGTPEYEEFWRNLEAEREKTIVEFMGGGVIEASEYDDYSTTSWMYKVDSEESIFNSLDGKAGNASREVANQLASLIFNTKDTDLETRAANREAARDLAKHIAENYMSDPKEAQAFIDEINKHIKDSELIDKGYVGGFYVGRLELTLPGPMSDEDRWLVANWNKYFGHFEGVSYKVSEQNTLGFVGDTGGRDGEFTKALHAAKDDYHAEAFAHFSKVNTPYKFWPDGSRPSWEEFKEMNCDPRFSMYSEENKAWYKDFLKDFVAKSNLVQDIIDNAKSITDFSGNEKWNIVMNLITINKGGK